MPEQRIGSTQRMSVLHGVGPKTETLLQRMGIETLADLFVHYPPRFVTYSELTGIGTLNMDDAGTPVVVCMEPIRGLVQHGEHGVRLCTGTFSDDSGEFSATRLHMPYLRETLQPSRRAILFGKIQPNRNRLHLQQP